jgi:hypothetical protein
MFWLGLCASLFIGGVLGIWFLTLVDGVRCRLIGVPDVRETRLYPLFEAPSAWWHLPFERFSGTHPDRLFAFLAVGGGMLAWGAAWSVFWLGGGSIGFWIWSILFLSGLLFIALLDGRWRVLPVEPLLVAGMVFGVGRWLLGGSFISILQGAFVMGVFFGIQSYFSRGKWLGSGDPVLAIAIGMALGWPLAPVAIYATYMAVIPLLLVQLIRVRSFHRLR